jgi:hypothetical protein
MTNKRVIRNLKRQLIRDIISRITSRMIKYENVHHPHNRSKTCLLSIPMKRQIMGEKSYLHIMSPERGNGTPNMKVGMLGGRRMPVDISTREGVVISKQGLNLSSSRGILLIRAIIMEMGVVMQTIKETVTNKRSNQSSSTWAQDAKSKLRNSVAISSSTFENSS